MQLIAKSFEGVIVPVLMLQISCKPVVHAHHDFKILMHNSVYCNHQNCRPRCTVLTKCLSFQLVTLLLQSISPLFFSWTIQRACELKLPGPRFSTRSHLRCFLQIVMLSISEVDSSVSSTGKNYAIARMFIITR